MSLLNADLIVKGGRVITANQNNETAEALAIKDGRVLDVGTTQRIEVLSGPQTKVMDLKGKVILPGFIDTHEHCMKRGLQMDWVNCGTPPMQNLADVIAALRAKATKKAEGEWIMGSWFDESQWPDKRFPNRWDLDQVSDRHPVHLARAGGHNLVVNSMALELAGISKNTPQPAGGNIERNAGGEPTGRLDEHAAMNLVRDIIPTPKEDKLVEILVENWPTLEGQCLRWGITGLHEAHTKAPIARAYQRLERQGRLKIRIGLMLDGMTPYLGHATSDLVRQGITTPFKWSDRLSVLGVKVGTDGAMGSRTAALSKDYANDPGNRGILRCTQKELSDEIARCHKGNIRTCTHAIGDRAIDMALNAIEAAVRSKPWPDHRHRIEHAGCVSPGQFERMARLGVNVSASIGFCYPIGDSHIAALGEDRLRGYYPMKSFKEHGIIAAGNSDGFGTDWPLTGIYGCVARRSKSGKYLCKDESISIMDAIKVYTVNAAFLEGTEDLKGSLTPGKFADFVVLDRDITTVPHEEILETRVLMTIINGEIAYDSAHEQ